VTANDPPLLIFHGDRDDVVLLDQSDRIVKLYKDADLDVQMVVLEGVGHGGKRFFRDQHLKTAVEFLGKRRPKSE
jgi:dipeptidyl aminopeptidase/acylaminoacyl peptidase